MKITVCEGNGQGICSRCGRVAWMPLLCKIENVPGHYCSNCVRKMKSLLEVEAYESDLIDQAIVILNKVRLK